MRRLILFTIAACFLSWPMGPLSVYARADEALRTLVVSGDWMAKEQQDPGTAERDVCIAFTAASDKGFGLRASTAGFEVRYSQNNWVLPDNVMGNLVFDVGPYHFVFAVTGNTRDTAFATVTREQLRGMISAMEKVSVMTVTAGTASPQRVSLRGSNRATTAFLHCVARFDAAGNDDVVDPLP